MNTSSLLRVSPSLRRLARGSLALAPLCLALTLHAEPAPDGPVTFRGVDGATLAFDFEGSTFAPWVQEGAAFGPAPARGKTFGAMAQKDVDGFIGAGFANSSAGNSKAAGTLTSPRFVIEQPYINFLVGGAKNPEKAAVRLIVDDKVVRTTTGPNVKYPESERLEWAAWNVAEFIGRPATIQIVGSGVGLEHINVDEIIPGDRSREEPAAARELVAEHYYLQLPVKKGARERRVRVVADGKIVREFLIELAEGKPDFQVVCDVAPFKGQHLRIETDHLPNREILERIANTDELPGAAELYHEKYRPQFHFSPKLGWVGDPNGLVYYKGEYHLYFQYNPYGVKWGNMHWGHAVSTDLVHWQELPITLYPPKYGDMPYSGSAVVDHDNTAGFKNGPEDPVVVFFPSTGRGICITYSNDRGHTFTEYTGNPLDRSLGSDNKVFWYEPTHQWVMVTCSRLNNVPPTTPDWLKLSQCGFNFFTSSDLKHWERQSRLDDYWECPELFELPVDGSPQHKQWVLYSNQTPSLSGPGKNHFGRYVIGSFDGKKFTEETDKLQLNFGNAYGAAQSYNDIPAADGRRINVGCAFRMPTPGMPFGQMMNFPTELTLQTTPDGPRLYTMPIKEIERLYTSSIQTKHVKLTAAGTALPGVTSDLLDLSVEFQLGARAEEVGLRLHGLPLTYNAKTRQLAFGDRSAPLDPVTGKIRLRVLVDRTSMEIFANDGRVYMPMAAIGKDEDKDVTAFATGGDAEVSAVTVNNLKSAWEP